MKRLISTLLAAVLAVTLLSGFVSSARAAKASVAILAYICGSDLESEEGEATGDIQEMIASGAGNTDAVRILFATGGSSRWQNSFGISSRNVQYYEVKNGSVSLLQDSGRGNMGDAATLSSFLRYAVSAAPADRYILILWDHGGGPVFGVCNDENYQDDSLSLSELRSGLKSGLSGQQLDIIAFDCCLMNCIDLCYDMVGIADYSVVSQELVSGTGLNYDEWIQPIVANPAVSTEQIAMNMADSYIRENSRGRYAETSTMSVVASDKMPAVMDAANIFSSALTAQISSNLSGIVRLRNQLTSFGEFLDYDASDLVDVSDMCDAFSALLPQESAALKQAAQQAVCYNVTTDDIASYAHGLSFFLPYATVRSDSSDILSHYKAESGAYANLAVAMTNQTLSSGYTMSASSYTPSNFYSYDSWYGSGYSSGAFCDVWDGYYGDYCPFDDVYDYCGGDIWSGLDTGSGCVWDGYDDCSGIWSGYSGYYDDGYGSGYNGGYSGGASYTPVSSGIWAGLPSDGGQQSGASATAAPGTSASQTPPMLQGASSALNNVWAGLLNSGSDYYQPGEQNQNVQAGVSEAVSAEDVIATAGTYFSSATLNSQMIYSVQLNKTDLDHLSSASGVLSISNGNEQVRLGNIGATTIDWSTGLIFSMFDGSWPMLGDQMVRAEFLYGDENGNVRFVIPARVNGLKMYLLGSRASDGGLELLGATQGYDENGFAIRGSIPLEEGMIIVPVFTAVAADGTEREFDGEIVTVPAEGLKLTWNRIPAGSYSYCFALRDLSGVTHYTDSVSLTF